MYLQTQFLISHCLLPLMLCWVDPSAFYRNDWERISRPRSDTQKHKTNGLWNRLTDRKIGTVSVVFLSDFKRSEKKKWRVGRRLDGAEKGTATRSTWTQIPRWVTDWKVRNTDFGFPRSWMKLNYFFFLFVREIMGLRLLK